MNPEQPEIQLHEEQNENLHRVRSRISAAIVEFIKERSTFHADELRQHVSDRVLGRLAPGSSDRVLRDLRQTGILNYRVVSRRGSLYEMLPLTDKTRGVLVDAS